MEAAFRGDEQEPGPVRKAEEGTKMGTALVCMSTYASTTGPLQGLASSLALEGRLVSGDIHLIAEVRDRFPE